MLAWKVAPALAAGNTVVLKPAEYMPLTALAFAQIVSTCGLLEGVLYIVPGDGSTGAALVGAEGVDNVAFTGSTEVGRIIRRQTAGTGRPLMLELGGKSPFVVFADADHDAAVEGVVDAIWFNQGQVCCAGTRILVAEAVAARFERKLAQRVATLRLGRSSQQEHRHGGNRASRPARAESVSGGQGEGRGAVLTQGVAPQGYSYPPTIASEVEPASTFATEEIFGPVATITTFRTSENAVALANVSRYGLAASIWSENVNLCLDLAAKVKAGVVWINGTDAFDAEANFGGYRESGFGREGGREGMAAYLRPPPAPRPGPRRRLHRRARRRPLRGSTGLPSSMWAACRSVRTRATCIAPLSASRASQPQGRPQCGGSGAQGVRLGEEHRP